MPNTYVVEMVVIMAATCCCVYEMEKATSNALDSGVLNSDLVDVIDKVFRPNQSSGGINWIKENAAGEVLEENRGPVQHQAQNTDDLLLDWETIPTTSSPNALSLFVGQSIFLEERSSPKHRVTTVGVNHRVLRWQELWCKSYNMENMKVSGMIASLLQLSNTDGFDTSFAELDYVVFPYTVLESTDKIPEDAAATEAVFGHQKNNQVQASGLRRLVKHVEVGDWRSLAQLLCDDEVRNSCCSIHFSIVMYSNVTL